MVDNEYLLDMKIKNNVLYQYIMSECDTVKEFANKYNICVTLLYGLLNFRQKIYNEKNKILPGISNLLKKLNCELSDIIPSDYEVKETNHFFKEIDAITMSQLSYQEEQNLLTDYTTEDFGVKSEMKTAVNNILKVLTPREERIVREYYYYGRTYDELGQEFGVHRERIRQILLTAMNKLRHPSRVIKLVGYTANPEDNLKYAKDMYAEFKSKKAQRAIYPYHNLPKSTEYFTGLIVRMDKIDAIYKECYPVSITFQMFYKLIQNTKISKKKFAIYMLKHNIRGNVSADRNKFLKIRKLFNAGKINFIDE